MVVNNCEERGIAVIKDFNKTLTKDEAQNGTYSELSLSIAGNSNCQLTQV